MNSYYKPCNRLDVENMGTGNQKVKWCRDFNAHNTLWGNGSTDHNGKMIEEKC